MDKTRAQEIISSPNMISVTYNGKEIYIENVNENTQTANIHLLNKPDKKQEVPLNNLVEH
ncbi:H-type small acid-soluble spore protein [Alkaliphilus metalliredigens]|uniref:Small, acid-soluble spore protein H n=1 Tax=Alkaliphilus metalliredigens (strain QYMF) TaxID=293826 RepID=SSPH_ALKMQ|nr:H-type small acid-soluble spore protein [Alkaliphilus metalliredigens]A6TQ57.2 RecName: Full=Small, acid-soluble spore protein H; Short=SASP H [Alkaliphilus metalliredigens QYMF]